MTRIKDSPIIVPTISHLIIPCILLFMKTYKINEICFFLSFSVSLLRAIVSFDIICKKTPIIYVINFLLFLDFAVVCIYIVFSILSKDPFICIFCIIYFIGFIWVFFELRQLKKNEEELEVLTEPIECCICCETINKGKRLSCEHIFHKECIDTWFREKPSCPYCRTENVS